MKYIFEHQKIEDCNDCPIGNYVISGIGKACVECTLTFDINYIEDGVPNNCPLEEIKEVKQ